MEEKKQKYKVLLEDLSQKNHTFVEVLEKLTKQHGSLVDQASSTIRTVFEATVGTELNHYDSLNMLAPDKAKQIKGLQLKLDNNADLKYAEEQSYKIDLMQAKQKLMDMSDGAINHQSMSPYCQYVTDTHEYYTKLTDRWSKYILSILTFF